MAQAPKLPTINIPRTLSSSRCAMAAKAISTVAAYVALAPVLSQAGDCAAGTGRETGKGGEDDADCKDCAAGTRSDSTKNECKKCDDKKFSDKKASECCTKDQYQESGKCKSKDDCKDGKKFTAGDDTKMGKCENSARAPAFVAVMGLLALGIARF